MFERFMRWIGYVPLAEDKTAQLELDCKFYRGRWVQLCDQYMALQAHLERLRTYVHVQAIEANINAGKARKK